VILAASALTGKPTRKEGEPSGSPSLLPVWRDWADLLILAAALLGPAVAAALAALAAPVAATLAGLSADVATVLSALSGTIRPDLPRAIRPAPPVLRLAISRAHPGLGATIPLGLTTVLAIMAAVQLALIFAILLVEVVALVAVLSGRSVLTSRPSRMVATRCRRQVAGDGQRPRRAAKHGCGRDGRGHKGRSTHVSAFQGPPAACAAKHSSLGLIELDGTRDIAMLAKLVGHEAQLRRQVLVVGRHDDLYARGTRFPIDHDSARHQRRPHPRSHRRKPRQGDARVPSGAQTAALA